MHIRQNAVVRAALLWCGLAGWCYCAGGFSIQTDAKGKTWFVDSQGKQFLSIGINDIIPEPWRPKPNTQYYNPVQNQFNGDFDAWKKDVFKIMQEHGFNTLGAWSDGRLYDGPIYGTACLYVASHEKNRCLDGLRPGFEDRIEKNIQIALETYPSMDNVFGVYLDNEMAWFGHAAWGDIPNYTLLESALQLPKEDPAHQAAVDFLKKRYVSAEALSKAWGKPLLSWDEITFDFARSCVNKESLDARTAFIELAADTFYKTACQTVRKLLPGKLILGTRFADYAPQPVIAACGRYCDVVSFNNYRVTPAADSDMLARFWLWGGKKPLMVTEYAWRAQENSSGNPNSGGAGAVVKTQAERARNYSSYVEDLLSYPMVIGAHWFEFADQSPQGRWDGENSNYGIVDIHHRPYKEMLAAMKKTNDGIEKLHAQSDRQAPQSLPIPKAVTFEPGQYPGRPPFIDVLNTAPAGEPELYHAPDAQINLKKEKDRLVVSFDTGKEWGCGVLFFGPKEFANTSSPVHAANMGGYSAIELDAVIGTNIVFDLFVDEAGIGPMNAASYDTSGGDDGEGFLIPSIQGKQTRSVYRLELKDLEARTNWGNQKGARKVDIHSIKGMSLFFHGGQGKDQVKIYSLKWVR